jgi:hypothetical protein
MIVVIPCGGKKLNRPAPACELYTGPYFKSCWNYARSLVPHQAIFILSAKHGLIKPYYPVAPYNLRMGDKYAVTAEEVREDAGFFGLLDEFVVGLGGRDYTNVMKEVWPDGIYPIAGISMGFAMKLLKDNRGFEIW